MAFQKWDDDIKIVVLVTVMFETWSEDKAPGYSPMATPLKEGTVDRHGISWSEYGVKTGIWRLMRILDNFGIRATVCVSGKSVELYPDAIKEILRGGHEVAGHSYTQDALVCYLSPAQEREVIQRCRGIIEEATGSKPVGWLSPRCTPTQHTAEILAKEGFLWHGDYNDTDLPYYLKTPKGPIVVIPQCDFTDNRVLRGNPGDFFQVYKNTFDYLYKNEPTGMINLTVHAHFGGRPLISAVVAEALKYMKGFSGVWFARHDEMARWVIDRTERG